MRAAANHEIQSPGGQITKHAQRAIWDLQPVGVHELVVAPMNVHDEVMCVTHPDYVSRVTEKVSEVVESYRPQVPLIGMTWNESQANWAEKKGGSVTVKMRAPEMCDTMKSHLIRYEIETRDPDTGFWKVRSTIEPHWHYVEQEQIRRFLWFTWETTREVIVGQGVTRIQTRKRAIRLAKRLQAAYETRVWVTIKFPGDQYTTKYKVWEDGKFQDC